MVRKNAEALGIVTRPYGLLAVTVTGESNSLDSASFHWWEHRASQARTGAFLSPITVERRKGGWQRGRKTWRREKGTGRAWELTPTFPGFMRLRRSPWRRWPPEWLGLELDWAGQEPLEGLQVSEPVHAGQASCEAGRHRGRPACR